jgi:hypothetical protein
MSFFSLRESGTINVFLHFVSVLSSSGLHDSFITQRKNEVMLFIVSEEQKASTMGETP